MPDKNLTISATLGSHDQFHEQLMSPTVEKLNSEVSMIMNKIIEEQPKVINDIITEALWDHKQD